MTCTSRFWADWSTRDFTQAQGSGAMARTIAVLPVAATEQHGPHLPLCVDSALIDGIVAAACPLLAPTLPVLFLPTQVLGLSPEHARFAGTLTLSAQTVIALWSEICTCVAATGVKKLLLFNSHGGQVSVMDIVARELRARLDLLVVSASWFNLPLRDADGHDVNALFDAREQRFGVHAGAVETSMMLALHPTLVDMAQAQDFASSSEQRAARFDILGNGKSAKLAWQTQDLNPAGAVGQANAASAATGQALVHAGARALAQLLAEMDQLSPADMLQNR